MARKKRVILSPAGSKAVRQALRNFPDSTPEEIAAVTGCNLQGVIDFFERRKDVMREHATAAQAYLSLRTKTLEPGYKIQKPTWIREIELHTGLKAVRHAYYEGRYEYRLLCPKGHEILALIGVNDVLQLAMPISPHSLQGIGKAEWDRRRKFLVRLPDVKEEK